MAIWQTVAGATVILTFISALLVRWTDPETIRTFGDGMWWAAQTVTTVGYGDIVLESAPGRAVGALVMFMGIAFITSTTAVMGTVFAESTRRRRGAVDRGGELERIHSRLDEITLELAALRAALADRGGGEAPPGDRAAR